MLRLIAKHANAWNSGFTDSESYKKELARLKAACKETGRNCNEIENTFQSRVIIAENDKAALKRAEK